jgi:cephalosporin hydroxylase
MAHDADIAPRLLRRMLRSTLYRRGAGRLVHRLFLLELIYATDNFYTVRWLGKELWQNVLDLWTIQETIAEIRPGVLIETGTHRAGSAMFYASLMDLMGHGRVITIDVEKLHDCSHPRIDFLLGSSTDPATVAQVRERTSSTSGPVLVILDSDHSEAHVTGELEAYASLVTEGSYLLVQDGIIDQTSVMRDARPGPLPAIRRFLARHPEYVHDKARNDRFLATHHPCGWLRRVGPAQGVPSSGGLA